MSNCCCEIIWCGAKAIGNVWAGYCIPAKSCVEWGQELLQEMTLWWLFEEASQQQPQQDIALVTEVERFGLLLEFTCKWWAFLPQAVAIIVGIVGDFVNEFIDLPELLSEVDPVAAEAVDPLEFFAHFICCCCCCDCDCDCDCKWWTEEISKFSLILFVIKSICCWLVDAELIVVCSVELAIWCVDTSDRIFYND